MSEMRRNEQIADLLERDKVPLLALELQAVKDALGHYTQRQRELGHAMSGAMSESSETAHDNAPAEAIAGEALINTKLARALMSTAKNAYEFDFDKESDVVTIGSIVTVKFGESSAHEDYLLTGSSRKPSQELLDASGASENIETVSLKSPLGRAVFDKKVGETATMNINGRMIPIEIVAIG